ncbi:DNA-3-methyladenine glycosylase I [Erysipelotrichaceae bacterium]|nr:DNA-3-methyladenine glycosylase I [Erysipelotrichaceae bacterium]
MMKKRCDWARTPLEIIHHDTIWGRPEHEDLKLFEFLILEGMQAGLSWNTILQKQENMRQAFDNFDPKCIAEYDEQKEAELLGNAGIIRNRLKIKSLALNAQAFLRVQAEFESFDAYIWGFVDNKPLVNNWETTAQIPTKTACSQKLSTDLLKRGFKFVGPTICYALMQTIGMVDDHLACCDWHD